MTEQILPLGTIVYLQEGTAKLMIVGRGAVFNDDEGQKISDYVGVVYPNGIDPNDALFFNHDDIDEVVFKGYSDDEEIRYLKVYEDWKQSLENDKSLLDENQTFGF